MAQRTLDGIVLITNSWFIGLHVGHHPARPRLHILLWPTNDSVRTTYCCQSSLRLLLNVIPVYTRPVRRGARGTSLTVTQTTGLPVGSPGGESPFSEKPICITSLSASSFPVLVIIYIKHYLYSCSACVQQQNIVSYRNSRLRYDRPLITHRASQPNPPFVYGQRR